MQVLFEAILKEVYDLHVQILYCSRMSLNCLREQTLSSSDSSYSMTTKRSYYKLSTNGAGFTNRDIAEMYHNYPACTGGSLCSTRNSTLVFAGIMGTISAALNMYTTGANRSLWSLSYQFHITGL